MISISYDALSINVLKVYQQLQEMHQSNVLELSRRTGLSESTVRRALLTLEERHLIRRYRGGAAVLRSRVIEPPALQRAKVLAEKKALIAQRAAEFISPGDSIMLTGGTTIASMCAFLKDIPDLTVITDSILVINALMYSESVKLIGLGGILNVGEQCLEGLLTSVNMKQLRVRKIFHGIKAIDPKDGFLTDDVRQVEFYRQCLSLAGELYILATSDKFECEGITPLYSPREVTRLITDSGAPKKAVQALERQSCIVTIVD